MWRMWAGELAELYTQLFPPCFPTCRLVHFVRQRGSSAGLLDAEITELVATVPPTTRNLVTNHDALGYFADRYGFTVIGTVIPSTSTMASTNPADLADLARLIAESGVTTIFTDAESSDIDAAALADRLDGVQVTPLLTGSLTSGVEDGRDYLTLMRTNAERIVVGSGGTVG